MTETKSIEDGYEVRRDQTGKLLGWRQLREDGTPPGPRPAVKTAPAVTTRATAPSAPVGPVFTFREVRNADGTVGAEKVDAAGNVVARLAVPPAGEIVETDVMGMPPLVERLNPANLEQRATSGDDFAAAVDAESSPSNPFEAA